MRRNSGLSFTFGSRKKHSAQGRFVSGCPFSPLQTARASLYCRIFHQNKREEEPPQSHSSTAGFFCSFFSPHLPRSNDSMGFCRQCGEIVSGDRCKCGGASRGEPRLSFITQQRCRTHLNVARARQNRRPRSCLAKKSGTSGRKGTLAQAARVRVGGPGVLIDEICRRQVPRSFELAHLSECFQQRR